jgi:hypothetical protein
LIGAYHTTYLDANISPATPTMGGTAKHQDPQFYMEYYERESINRMLFNQTAETNERVCEEEEKCRFRFDSILVFVLFWFWF